MSLLGDCSFTLPPAAIEKQLRSIYDSPTTPGSLTTAPPTNSKLETEVLEPLEMEIRHVRLQLLDRFHVAHIAWSQTMDAWFALEARIQKLARTLWKASEEPLLPGITYAVVGGMAGSIVSRNRGILSRLLTPVTFATLTAAYFLPNTTRVAAWALSDRYLLDAEKRRAYVQQWQRQWQELRAAPSQWKQQATTMVEDQVHSAETTLAQTLEQWKQAVEQVVRQQWETIRQAGTNNNNIKDHQSSDKKQH